MIRSGVPPLSRAYEALYDAIGSHAVRRMRRRFDAEIAAIYLRGSAAMDFRIPGLSDIDFTIVLDDAVDEERHRAVIAAWRHLAGQLPVLEASPWIMRRREFERLAHDNPGVRFRVMESRRSWKLLHGSDLLAELPEFAGALRHQALTDDLETRLTYLNGLLFLPRRDDGLELRRLEYLLYKLVLDLARILHDSSDAPLQGRGETRAGFLAGDLSIAQVLGTGEDTMLREFVAHTARHRLRRTWSASRAAAILLAGELVVLTFATLGRCYADAELMALPGVAEQAAAFYSNDRFAPTGNRFVRIDGTTRPFAELHAEVCARLTAGIHTVVETHGLRINLANTDPALGNCTVVPVVPVVPLPDAGGR